MTKSDGKKVVNWGIFICLIASFLFFANKYDLNNHTAKFQRYKNINYAVNSQPADIVLIGNSHMYYGVIPNVMNDLLPEKTTFSMVIYPSSPLQSYTYLKEIVTGEQPPEVVVLEAFVLTSSVNQLDYSLFPQNNLSLWQSIFRNVTPAEQLRWLFPITSTHTLWKNASEVIGSLRSYPMVTADIEGLQDHWHVAGKSVQNSTVMSQWKFNLAYQKGFAPLSSESDWILEELVDLCEENGVKLVLLYLPTVNQWGLEDAEMQALAKKFDLTYYDFNQILAQHYSSGRILFLDTDEPQKNLNSHLNTMGALLSSITLAEKLSLDINTLLNEEQRSLYEEVLVEDVLINGLDVRGEPLVANGMLSVEVLPIQPGTEMLYEWEIHDESNGTSAYYQAPSVSPTISFPADLWREESMVYLTLHHPVLENFGGSIRLDFGY